MPEILLFNKPFGVLSQFSDGEGRETLSAYIPLPGFYPAGRLDRDSEGLLVLTNAGRLQHRISDPMHKQPKTYWVQVEGLPDRGALARLEQGVELRDGLTAPARAFLLAEPEVWPRTPPIRHRAQIPTAWVELVLTEGRNRQVRRMTAAVGYPTLRLIRHAVGPWDLSGLAPGTWRVLGAAEPTVVKLMHDMGTPRNRGRRGRTERAIPDRRRTGRGPDRR